MSIVIDTNVLLHRTQPSHENYRIAVESVALLLNAGEPVYFTLQNIAEFWNVATRPIANNGFGFSTTIALNEIQKIEQSLALLPDIPAMYAEWRNLVVKHSVLGVKVHDTRLVAAMNVHGIRRLLTFNVSDFTRYEIEVVHPSSLLP